MQDHKQEGTALGQGLGHKGVLDQKNLRNPKISLVHKSVWMVGVVGFWLTVDHLTKVWILENAAYLPRALTSFWNVVCVQNRGVSFGLLKAGSTWQVAALCAFSFLLSLGVGGWYFRSAQRLSSLGLLLILAGALGNLVDRVLWGSVVDFVDLHWATFHFPAFNVADSCITVGAGSLIWGQSLQESPKARDKI